MSYSKLNDPRKDTASNEITSTGALTAGECVMINGVLVYLLSGATASGQQVTVVRRAGSRGLTLPKQPSLAIAWGDKVYYDTTAKEIDKTNTNEYAGRCIKAAAGSDTVVEIDFFPIESA